jgi:ferredoxin
MTAGGDRRSHKVIVDMGRCVAHGECVAVAPQIFDLGEDDPMVTVLDPEPNEQLSAVAEAAARACPAAAIRIEP